MGKVTTARVPHLAVVVTVTAFVLIGFAAVSAYVLMLSTDEVTTGNIIGTWQNFALLAVGFWIGSSSAGKAKDGEPTAVTVRNPPDKPVMVRDAEDGLPEPTFGKE